MAHCLARVVRGWNQHRQMLDEPFLGHNLWCGLPRRFASSWSRWYASGGSSNVSVAIIVPPGKIRFIACLPHSLCFLVCRTPSLSLFYFLKECAVIRDKGHIGATLPLHRSEIKEHFLHC